jgi:hypothetical protein
MRFRCDGSIDRKQIGVTEVEEIDSANMIFGPCKQSSGAYNSRKVGKTKENLKDLYQEELLGQTMKIKIDVDGKGVGLPPRRAE